MKRLHALTIVMLLASGLSHSASIDEPIMLGDNQAIIQVKGIVCSFCAYGAEKNLSKLDFLDTSYFGGNGVLVDIHTHRITLALNNSKVVDYAAIHNAILKGGYDPIAYYARVLGKVNKKDGNYELMCSNNGQVYRLQGKGLAELTQLAEVYVEGQIPVETVVDVSSNHPTSLIVERIAEQ